METYTKLTNFKSCKNNKQCIHVGWKLLSMPPILKKIWDYTMNMDENDISLKDHITIV